MLVFQNLSSNGILKICLGHLHIAKLNGRVCGAKRPHSVSEQPIYTMSAKVRKPKFKSSVENAVGILEKGFFHKLEERQYFSLEQFNKDLWKELDALNKEPFKKKEHNRLLIS